MTTIKAHNATEFLTLLPQMIGYTPTNSIVIIPFTGNRTTGALRLDIPSDNQRNALINLAISLIARIDRADGITIAIYAEKHTTHAALAAALVTAFNRAGYTIHDTLYATGEGGGTYGHEPAPLPTNTPGDQHTGATLPRRAHRTRSSNPSSHQTEHHHTTPHGR